jgi:hypothetical protein
MKLESLKTSKFEAFKGSELQNSFITKGGQINRTKDSVPAPAPYEFVRYVVHDRYDTEHKCMEIWDGKAWV